MQRSRSSTGRTSTGGRPSLALRVKNDGGGGGSKLPKPRSSSGNRLSFANNGGVGTSGGRNLGTSGGRNSFSKSRLGGANAMETNSRSRQSLLHYGSHHEQMKDPRPIGDRSYKDKCIRQLIEFLHEQKYPFQLSPKLLHSPTTNDFKRIFEFLNGFFIPKYKCGPKIEEEIPQMLRAFGYPFPISKSAMFTVGSPHTWPTLLAALTWMREQITLGLNTEVDGLLYAPCETDDGFDKVPEDKIVFQYVEKSYSAFLKGVDDFTPLEEELKRKLRENTAGGNLEDLADANYRLSEELARLEQQPDELRNQQKILDTLQADVNKLQDYVNELNLHKQQHSIKLKTTEDELMEKEAELQQLLADNARKQKIFDTQELSPADIQRINAEREERKRNINTLESEIDDVDKQTWSLEMGIRKKHDKCESKCREYNQFGYKLQLIPVTAENAFGVDYELTPSTAQQHQFTATVKPALMQVHIQCGDKQSETFEKKLGEAEDLEHLTDMVHDAEENVRKLEEQHKSCADSLETNKEQNLHECEKKQLEIDSLEQEVTSLRRRGGMTALEANKALTEDRAKYEELRQDRSRQLKQYSDFLIKALEMVMDHKTTIQQDAQKRVASMEGKLAKAKAMFPAANSTDSNAGSSGAKSMESNGKDSASS